MTWTRAATRNRFVWSRDALLLACDAFEQADAQNTLRRLDDLAINAIHIAAHAQMRLITSWCVSGSTQHSGRIERVNDIGFLWRRRPAVWPPPDMLSKLAELRTRWPTLGDDSEIEHDHPRPDATS